MIGLFLVAVILNAESPEPPITYGEVYFEETRERQAPFFILKSGYAQAFNNSYLDLHSLVVDAEIRVWKYLSTGVMAQFIHAEFSDAGQELRALSSAGLISQIETPRWGIFSNSSLNFMIGQWNVLNLMPLRVDLILGGGFGVMQKRDDYDGASHSILSYLWSVEQRFLLFESAGVYTHVFGNRGGSFLGAGLHANFN